MLPSAALEAAIERAWKTAGWTVALVAVSLAAALLQVWVTDRHGSTARAGAVETEPGQRSLFEPTTVLRPLGRFPSARVTYDPNVAGMLYSGGERSSDGGLSWRALAGPDGTKPVVLGGARALAPVPGPRGRLLLGDVLLDEPMVALGQGRLVHGVEWNGIGWTLLAPADEESLLVGLPQSWSRARVRGLAYLADGRRLVASSGQLAVSAGPVVPMPDDIDRVVISTHGEVYATTARSAAYPLYVAAGPGAPWLPAAGLKPVEAAAAGPDGTVYLASGGRLGRGRHPDWSWSRLPSELRAREIAAHPRAPLVAIWGEGRLAVSKDGGATSVMCRLNDASVAWAAWDPFATDELTLVEPDGNALRLRLDSVR